MAINYTAESKRFRIVHGADDLISDMPEIIISHILSSLPTKDAVRTCVLSRNWKYKWTCITDVDVYDSSICSLRGDRWRHKVASYTRFVNRFIALSKTSRISRFRLYFHPKNNSELLQSWITALLRRNLQRLHLTASYIQPIVSSSWLSGWTSLIDMNLNLNCTLSVSTVNCCPNLKNLSLCSTTLKSSGGRRVLLNFPVLESLILKLCQWLDVDSVVIHAPSLIRFTIMDRLSKEPPNKYEIKLCAPKLDEFETHNGEIRNMVLEAPAVTRATLFLQNILNIEPPLPSYSILKGFTNLKSLFLTREVVKGLIKSRTLLSCLKTILDGVKEFELGYFMGPDREILEFLEWMPYLESLNIDMGMPRNENDSEYSGGITPPFANLKELTCSIWERKIDELAVLESILNNSKNLKKLLVLADGERRRREIRTWLSKILTKGSRCAYVVHVEKCS